MEEEMGRVKRVKEEKLPVNVEMQEMQEMREMPVVRRPPDRRRRLGQHLENTARPFTRRSISLTLLPNRQRCVCFVHVSIGG